MRVLITGSAGFIGSNLADRLLARGDEILVIDNFATGRRDNLTERAKLTIVEGTIADSALMLSTTKSFNPNVIVHAAAAYKDPEAWEEDVTTNVLGSVNVTRAAQACGARIIYFQTALCYGLRPLEQPITLEHPLRPDGSSYAFSKTAAEQYIDMSGVDYVAFRLANAYGPRNISGPLPTFFHRLTNGKKCFVMDTRRDFIYITDLIDVVVKAIDGQGRRGAYHVSSGSDVSIKELFDATLSALDITLDEDVEVRPRGEDDAYTILLDPSATGADFNWSVSTALEDGVAHTVAYYREFGIEETYTHLRLEDDKPAAQTEVKVARQEETV